MDSLLVISILYELEIEIFKDCDNLTSIDIQKEVKYIESGAFL